MIQKGYPNHAWTPLWNTFATNFFIMIPIDTSNTIINAPLLKYYYSTML
jgi:hypothetical protein